MEKIGSKGCYTPYKKNEKIRIVLLFQAASVWASWETFYNACMDAPDIEIKVLLLTELSVEKAQMISAKSFLEAKQIPYNIYETFGLEEYRPHIAFVQFPYDLAFHAPGALSLRLKSMGIRVAYIPYGIEISDTEQSRRDHFENYVVENSWRIFTCCDAIKEEYKKYCRNREAVRVCGSPKFDGVIRRESYPLQKDIFEKSAGRKILVWKMHFPKKIYAGGRLVQITPELEEYITFAKGLERYKDLFFVVMVHPKMSGGMLASDIKGDLSLNDKVSELLELVRSKENAILDTTDDYRNSFYHAEAIIMDRSALVIEAAMTGKPVLLMKNADYEEPWAHGVKQIVDTFRQGCTEKDMREFAEAFQKNELGYQIDTQAALQKYFPYQDGLCGERVRETVRADLMEEEAAAPCIKIVLYGAGAVCSYYLRQQFLKKNAFRILNIVDGNADRFGEVFEGYEIMNPEILQEMVYDAVVIMTEQNYYEIKKRLVYGLYIDERKIWRLDAFLEMMQN